jgi:hypothetical protein
MNIVLPIEPRQKFQVGDICEIVEKGIFEDSFSYPKRPLDPYLQNRQCIILHTYSQVFWGTNFTDYAIYRLPRKRKPQWTEEDIWLDKMTSGFLAWIEENQLRFIRKPNEEEVKIVIDEDIRSSNNGSPYVSLFSFNFDDKKFREDNGLELFITNLIKDDKVFQKISL